MDHGDDGFREVLETKRVEIVRGLNCEKTLLFDHLRSNQVFDQTDCELIQAETTNDARAGKLLDILQRKGTEAYEHFVDVIQIENPSLFYTLTGVKASSKPSPLMKQLAFPELRPGDYSQLQPFIENQQRMLEDLRDGAQRYRNLLKANEDLEKQLERAKKDLDIETERRQNYERKYETDESLVESQIQLFHEYDEMEKAIKDRDIYIIVLQMKLLAEKEEVEKLRTKIEELEHKHENMSRELRRVSQSYNNEKCQSLKLSECIRMQVDEIQKADDLRKQLRETKFQKILIQEERDSKVKELDELRKWAEALKTRFDVVEKEKQDSMEKNEAVENNCVYLRETIRMLNQKLSSAQLQVEELRKRNELLTKDCEMYKTQRNYALEARKEAVCDRDKITAERDAIQSQCNDLLGKREQMNEERTHMIQSFDALQTRYKTTSDELTRVKTTLNERALEAEHLTRLLAEAEEKNKRQSQMLMESLPGNEDGKTSRSLEGTSNEVDETAEEDEVQNSDRPWKERRLKSLLNSIKLRIAGERTSYAPNRDTASFVTGSMTLDVWQYLLPNLTTRPRSSAESSLPRSLERHKCLRGRPRIGCSDVTKARALTAPGNMETPERFFNDEGDRIRDVANIKSASSPDLLDPEDVDRLPPFFRSRSNNLTTKFRRSISTD